MSSGPVLRPIVSLARGGGGVAPFFNSLGTGLGFHLSIGFMAAFSQKTARSLPLGLKWRSHTLFILCTVGLGIFTDLFLYGLIVPVLPFMLREQLHIPDDEVQRRVDEMLALYAGGSVLFAPVAGLIADRMSSRTAPFLAGLVALFAATVLLAIGQTLPVLFLARLLQGISAAVVWPVGLALTMDTVGAQKLGTAIGTMLTFATSGLLIAPTIGGTLYEHLGYLGVLAVGGLLLLVDFTMRLLVIEKRMAAQYHHAEAGNAGGDHGPPRGHDEVEAAETTSLLARSALEAYRIPAEPSALVQRFPALCCLGNGSLIASLVITMVQGIMYGSFDATLPLYAQEVFGFNSAQAGLLFISLGLTDMLSGPIIGRMVDRYGTKIMATLAYLYLAGGLVFLRTVSRNTADQLILYCALLALCGIGLGLITTPALVEGGLVVQRYYEANAAFFRHQPPYALLYGINQTVYMVGLTLGPLMAGDVKEWVGYGNMNTLLALLSVLTAAVAWCTLGDRPGLGKRSG